MKKYLLLVFFLMSLIGFSQEISKEEEKAWTYESLGSEAFAQKDYEMAKMYYEKSLETFEHPDRYRIPFYLGYCEYLLGGDFDAMDRYIDGFTSVDLSGDLDDDRFRDATISNIEYHYYLLFSAIDSLSLNNTALKVKSMFESKYGVSEESVNAKINAAKQKINAMKNGPYMVLDYGFDHSEHTLTVGGAGNISINYRNDGSEALVVKSVVSESGSCVVKDFDEYLEPGEDETIEFLFDTRNYVFLKIVNIVIETNTGVYNYKLKVSVQ